MLPPCLALSVLLHLPSMLGCLLLMQLWAVSSPACSYIAQLPSRTCACPAAESAPSRARGSDAGGGSGGGGSEQRPSADLLVKAVLIYPEAVVRLQVGACSARDSSCG